MAESDESEERYDQQEFPVPVGSINTGQASENDVALTVVVCAPSALSKMMGSLHPAAALYETPVNTQLAVKAHNAAVSLLRERGVTVHEVRDILVKDVRSSVGARMDLEKLALSCLTYTFDRGASPSHSPIASSSRSATGPGTSGPHTTANPSSNDLGDHSDRKVELAEAAKAEQYYVSDAYKRMVIKEMDEQQLADVIFTNPTVTVSPSGRDTGFTASYKFEPLTNITFVRDQQITTRRGIVMGRLRSAQRKREVDVMQFCLRKLDLYIIGRVSAPGFLEGGDFIPASAKLAFVGIGPRTNWSAVEYLMAKDLVGTAAVAVVKDNLDQNQQRMHLDTVFNIVSDTTCVMLEDIMGEESGTRRVVDEYVHVGRAAQYGYDVDESATDLPMVGDYQLQKRDVEFSRYVKESWYDVIAISGEQQLKYGCNLLNLGDGLIIMTEREAARVVAADECFCKEGGRVQWLDFRGVTCMYGGLHCATQVVHRKE